MVTLLMGKIRRSNYIFLTWKGDHSPRHVHVYAEGKPILKWDLDNERAMKGRPTKKIVALIHQLKEEGLL
jgi:hypothetical protein